MAKGRGQFRLKVKYSAVCAPINRKKQTHTLAMTSSSLSLLKGAIR